MKKFLLIVCSIALVSGLMCSCKSQKSLAEATTVADPASAQADEVVPVQYNNSQASKPKSTPVPTVMPGDRQEKVAVVGSANLNILKDYNVVVGSFGNKANADNMKAKMVSRGYEAFLVQNTSGMYRVVAGSFDTREAATTVRDLIRRSYPTEAGTCAEAWLLIPQR